jgi:hypothetical protein
LSKGFCINTPTVFWNICWGRRGWPDIKKSKRHRKEGRDVGTKPTTDRKATHNNRNSGTLAQPIEVLSLRQNIHDAIYILPPVKGRVT